MVYWTTDHIQTDVAAGYDHDGGYNIHAYFAQFESFYILGFLCKIIQQMMTRYFLKCLDQKIPVLQNRITVLTLTLVILDSWSRGVTYRMSAFTKHGMDALYYELGWLQSSGKAAADKKVKTSNETAKSFIKRLLLFSNMHLNLNSYHNGYGIFLANNCGKSE